MNPDKIIKLGRRAKLITKNENEAYSISDNADIEEVREFSMLVAQECIFEITLHAVANSGNETIERTALHLINSIRTVFGLPDEMAS